MSDCVSIWKKCLDIIEKSEKISIATYKTWFAPVEPVALEGSVLTLEVPTKDFVDKLEGEYFEVFSGAIRAVIGPNAGLKYTYHVISSTPEGIVTEQGQKHAEPMGGGPILGVVNPFAMVGCRQLNIDPELNSNFTFENYVIGDGNKFACSVAMAVAKAPGANAFNPLFVFGNSGVGKTHLIQAIGAEVKSKFSSKNVVYLSADRFMRQYMEATKNNTLIGFLNFYQMIDVLIIDDIQEIAGKTSTENVFFQIFNHLQQNKKQIVIAADKSPAAIEGMEDRLLSRFKSGVSVEVKMPDYDTRVRIIKSKVMKDGILIPEEIIRFVANNVSGSVRELEGSLYSMLAFATLTHEDITMDVARQAVGHLVRNEVKEVNVDTIIEAVCRHYNMNEEALQKDTRKREIVVARQVAMYLCKELTQTSLSTIGMRLGNRNHATVLYSCKTVKDMIDTDKDFESHIKQIENNIRG